MNQSYQIAVQFQHNTLMLSGDLSLSNVMLIYNTSLKYLKKSPEIFIDFSQVKSSNSAGIALIIEWIKFSKRCKKRIHFLSVPANLRSIAEVSGLDHLFLRDP